MAVARSKDGSCWTLIHPHSAQERADDIDEVRQMIEAGELEVAVDELRWLVGGCAELLEAHMLLGELALEIENDLALARGHFGVAYQLGQRTLRRAKVTDLLPYRLPANQAFYQAAKGLAWCLNQLDKPQMADEIVAAMLKLDPSDPVELAAMIDDLRTGGAPIVELTDITLPPTD